MVVCVLMCGSTSNIFRYAFFSVTLLKRLETLLFVEQPGYIGSVNYLKEKFSLECNVINI